jgi:putative FmdB family regulatory protein
MPIYEYFCADCRTKFEALRPMAQADAIIACEACGGGHTARVLSVFAIKGSDGASVMETRGGSCACGGACACGAH